MPQVPASEHGRGDAHRVGIRHRLLLAMPRLRRDADRPPLGERLRDAMLKPAGPSTATPPAGDARTPEELESALRHADDTERLIGLVAAPVAAALSVVITSADISHDHKHTAVYHELLVVLLALALAMMAAAWFRKRLYVGVAMALYGITVFNLKYWGFGVPFAMGGAFYMVRSFRLSRALRQARDELPGGSSPRTGPVPGGSGRYTPPRRRPSGATRPRRS